MSFFHFLSHFVYWVQISEHEGLKKFLIHIMKFYFIIKKKKKN